MSDARVRTTRRAFAALMLTLTAVSAVLLVTKVRLSPDIAALLPDTGESAALGRYARAFGGGEQGLVLVEAATADEANAAAADVAQSVTGPLVQKARDRLELPHTTLSPSQWLLLAAPSELEKARALLSSEGMRARLRETRALLLAPGGSALASDLTRDPLRIGQLVASSRAPAQGVPQGADGAIASDDGRARLVTIEPAGNALRSDDARGFVDQVEQSLEGVRARHPGVSVRLTGGHALAAATEQMLRRDLTLSSILSLGLSSLIFALIFRRVRALLAILPPLSAGTLIAAATAVVFPRGISGIATAFASVVIGVGMDTGVHVYAAVQAALAEGHPDPWGEAIRRTARPVMGAALVAGAAFGCMALSDIEALRQLGLLSAVGEVATAVAILALTPPIALFLERRAKPEVTEPAAWTAPFATLASKPLARPIALVACVSLFAAVLLGMLPSTASGLVAIRPSGLAPNDVYADIAKRFGTDDRAPWVVLVEDASAEKAASRTDVLYEQLASRKDVVSSVDALTPWAPSEASLSRRVQARDALGLEQASAELERALRDEGFAPAKFQAALGDLAQPASAASLSPVLGTTRELFGARYHASGEGQAQSVLFVQADDEQKLEQLVASIDAAASVTGYPRLEPSLRRALLHELPRVGSAAIGLATVALWLALRRVRDVAIALAVVGVELSLVLLAMRLLGVPLHVFDALVLPVLLGITLDEVLFVMSAARSAPDAGPQAALLALRHEAPLVATTACTTAVGFGALVVCRFDPLRHLGIVGAVGSIAGLLLALLVVPAVVMGGRARR